MTFEKARDFLIFEERTSSTNGASLAGMAKKEFRKKLTLREKMTKYPCHICGEKGHFRKNCPKAIVDKSSQSKPNEKPKPMQRALGALVVQLKCPCNNIKIHHLSR